MSADSFVRPRKQWPGWMDDLLGWGPLAELEAEWRAEVGDAITRVLDSRAESVGGREAPDTKEPT